MNKILKLWIRRYKFLTLALLSAIALTGTVLFLPKAETQPEQARSADSFVDSIGVVVHLNYADTAYARYDDIIKPRLQELGIRHIRDGVALGDTATQQKFLDLATIGIKSILVMDPRYGQTVEDAVNIAKIMANSIEGVEGANEWDLHTDLQYKGQNFPDGVRTYQAELYAAIKADSAIGNLDVLGPSIAFAENAVKLGSVACDIGTMHSYPGWGQPSWELDNRWIPATRIMCGDKPIVATESGYHNAINEQSGFGVSEQASAKYLPRLFLEYFNRGIKRAYSYELIDQKPNPEANNSQLHYGLLRYDGSPKPAFIAVKNLISLLQDSGDSFEIGSLDYSLSGDTTDVHHTLLQKRDGKFYLILWQEVASFNKPTNADVDVPSRKVTLTLNTAIKNATTYQPIESVNPLKKSDNPKQLKLKIPDAPIVVELIPV
ncbi:hypothetical protein [Aerosakkonema funiforme]|uniref:hypothetical protein n=1 Tax=Aerosakkonema funiforme TaxID=1246630 RepID=UPI0035B7B2F6